MFLFSAQILLSALPIRLLAFCCFVSPFNEQGTPLAFSSSITGTTSQFPSLHTTEVLSLNLSGPTSIFTKIFANFHYFFTNSISFFNKMCFQAAYFLRPPSRKSKMITPQLHLLLTLFLLLNISGFSFLEYSDCCFEAFPPDNFHSFVL